MAVFLVFAGDFVDVLPGGKGGQDAERRHPGGEKEMGQRQAIFLQQLLARMPRGAGRCVKRSSWRVGVVITRLNKNN